MRNMSFALTTEQMKAKTKTVTRRVGWTFLKPGDFINAVEKCQGLKEGRENKAPWDDRRQEHSARAAKCDAR